MLHNDSLNKGVRIFVATAVVLVYSLLRGHRLYNEYITH